MNVAQMLERSAFYFPDRSALVFKEGMRAEADTLRAFCKEKIASYKLPETIEFVPALPKSPTGKILRKELRAA